MRIAAVRVPEHHHIYRNIQCVDDREWQDPSLHPPDARHIGEEVQPEQRPENRVASDGLKPVAEDDQPAPGRFLEVLPRLGEVGKRQHHKEHGHNRQKNPARWFLGSVTWRSAHDSAPRQLKFNARRMAEWTLVARPSYCKTRK